MEERVRGEDVLGDCEGQDYRAACWAAGEHVRRGWVVVDAHAGAVDDDLALHVALAHGSVGEAGEVGAAVEAVAGDEDVALGRLEQLAKHDGGLS